MVQGALRRPTQGRTPQFFGMTFHFRNDRKAYVEAWWNVVDWGPVAARYERARTVAWKPE